MTLCTVGCIAAFPVQLDVNVVVMGDIIYASVLRVDVVCFSETSLHFCRNYIGPHVQRPSIVRTIDLGYECV